MAFPMKFVPRGKYMPPKFTSYSTKYTTEQ